MELDGFCQARVGTTCTRRYGAISASQVQSSHYTVLRDVTYLFMGRCFSFTYFRRLFRRLYSQACSGTRVSGRREIGCQGERPRRCLAFEQPAIG